jgi:hypothetical protein
LKHVKRLVRVGGHQWAPVGLVGLVCLIYCASLVTTSFMEVSEDHTNETNKKPDEPDRPFTDAAQLMWQPA